MRFLSQVSGHGEVELLHGQRELLGATNMSDSEAPSEPTAQQQSTKQSARQELAA